MSPAEQLRAAAAKLRDTAAKAECWDAREVHDGEVTDWEKYYGHSPEADLPEGDGQWIVLMSPAVAEPLAAWLYDASLEYERTLRDHGPDAATYAVYHAMPVALAILGEAP